MQRAPCEYIVWNGLPIIRRELAACMIHEFGLNQKETAKRLGITPAAVCQYMGNKRGKIRIVDKKILKEIKISAEKIMKEGEKVVVEETCRICRLLSHNGEFMIGCEYCKTNRD